MATQGAIAPDGSDDLAPLVLAIDDDPRILGLLKLVLSQAGYRVETADSGDAGVLAAAELHPDIVLLDLLMPKTSGLDVLAALKDSDPDRPVVICTVSTDERTKLEALKRGADDFIGKPFAHDDLISRIRFLLTSPGEGAERSHLVRLGGLEIDLHHHTVKRDGEPVLLSKTEWQLLTVLVSYDGEPALFSDLLVKVWGAEYREDVRYLRMWIARLGKKLNAAAAPGDDLLLDFHGVGYRLNYGLPLAHEDEAAAVD